MAIPTHGTESDQKQKPGLGHRMLQRMVMPVAAAAASAVATYAVRKAPQLVDEKVVPKLRDWLGEAGDAAQELPSRARSAAGDASDMAERLTDRVTSAVGRGSDENGSGPSRNLSTAELRSRRAEREQHRSARRRTSK